MESVPTAQRDRMAVMGLLDFCKGVAIVWIVLVHILHGVVRLAGSAARFHHPGRIHPSLRLPQPRASS